MDKKIAWFCGTPPCDTLPIQDVLVENVRVAAGCKASSRAGSRKVSPAVRTASAIAPALTLARNCIDDALPGHAAGNLFEHIRVQSITSTDEWARF